MTYFEFIKRFPTEVDALAFIIEHKYPNHTYVCPKCGSIHKVYHQKYDPRKFYCENCKHEFSVLTGTIFENTHLDLRMWLYAINLVIIAKKGISALQLRRELGMNSYKGAWRMMHKIREAMAKDEMREVFEAIVEIDETYVGGKPRKPNKRGKDKKKTKEGNADANSNTSDNGNTTDKKDDASKNNEPPKNKRGRGTSKTPVIGVKERNSGRVHAVVANKNAEGKRLTGKQLFKVLAEVCKDDTTVVTDQFSGYNILDGKNEKNFIRLQIDHNVAYSLGNGIHTNGIESFWALLKRGIHGVFHHISVKHMQKYVNEFCFRLNYRQSNEAFEKLVELSVVIK